MGEKISKLTPEEKNSLLRGAGNWKSQAIPRLSIPSFTMSDGPSGLRKEVDERTFLGESEVQTLLPCPSLLAATFSREMAFRHGFLLGKEARFQDIDLLLAPGLNIQRDPRGGRNFEYYSEDPLLSGILAGEEVLGIEEAGTGATLKHFAVNSEEQERMTLDEIVDERALHEIYLRGFEIAIERGKPSAVMAAYNKVNNVHACENAYLLQDVLRKEWHFDGLVLSDWFAVNDPVLSIENGLDLEMPKAFDSNALAVQEALKDRAFSKKAEESLKRIVSFAEREKKEKTPVDPKKNHEEAVTIAKEGMVLLKNEGLLPLQSQADILVVGELSIQPHIQGGGSSHVHPFQVPSFLSLLPEGTNYAPGYSLNGESKRDLVKEAVEMAKKHDIVLLFLGFPDALETEGEDKKDIHLPPDQQKLFEALTALPCRIVLILEAGSPVLLDGIEKADSILFALLGGEGTNEALFDLLYGRSNPSGHLPMTFPKRLADCPSYKDFPTRHGFALHRESVFVGYRYYETRGMDVLFPFGHGLSYSSFRYDNLHLEKTHEGILVRFLIENVSSVSGKAVPQLYLGKPDTVVFVPKWELANFDKVLLESGEKKEIRLVIPRKSLSYYDIRTKSFRPLFGKYKIAVGESVRDLRLIGEIDIPGENDTSPYDEKVLSLYRKAEIDQVDEDPFLSLFAKKPLLKEKTKIDFDTSLEECTRLGSPGAKAFLKIATAFEPLKSQPLMRQAFRTSPLRVLCGNEKSLARNKALLMRLVKRRFYLPTLLLLLLKMATALRELKKTN